MGGGILWKSVSKSEEDWLLIIKSFQKFVLVFFMFQITIAR